jgi:hypothetical protein
MAREDSREQHRRSIPEPGADRWVPRPDLSDALAEVVRKAREAGGAAPLQPLRPRPRQLDPIGPDEALVVTDPVAPGRPPRRPPESRSLGLRRLLAGVAAVAVVAIILGAADLAVIVSHHQSGAPRASGSAPASSPATSTTRPPGAGSTSTTTTAAAPSSTTAASAGAGSPHLSSVTPGHGAAGRVVTVHGSNLYSPSTGVVLARVDGMPAPTECPSQSTCQVTIPQLPSHPRTAYLSITTQSGTSNPLTFRYV